MASRDDDWRWRWRNLPKGYEGKPSLRNGQLYQWIASKEDILNKGRVQGWVDKHRVECMRAAMAHLEQLLADPKMNRKALLTMMRQRVDEINEFGP